jgi:hypothetical protein
MIPPPDPQYELDVDRADLVQALKIIARVVAKSPCDASFRFENGCLSIAAGETMADTPARGTWPLPIFVGATWVRRLARSMPPGNPVHLRVNAGRLHANRYSEPCTWAPMHQAPPTLELIATDENRLILEAARILKPLLTNREALESLVLETRARGPAQWRQEEKKMIALMARAWEILAPLGVETSDIRRLVEKAVRNGWK